MQFIVIACVFLGEFFIIYSVQLGSKLYALSGNTFFVSLAHAFLPAVTGALLLVTGYMLGVKYHENIWAVTAISFGTILIVEPLFNLFYIGHMPDTSETIGMILGILGIISVVFF